MEVRGRAGSAHESAQQQGMRRSEVRDRTLDLDLDASEGFNEDRVWGILYLSGN